jgi:hypothetical protein
MQLRAGVVQESTGMRTTQWMIVQDRMKAKGIARLGTLMWRATVKEFLWKSCASF